jgi:hypothetical protein
MARTILVVVRPQTNVELMLRRLKDLIKPGQRIVFLLSMELDVSMVLLTQVASLQTGFRTGSAWRDKALGRSSEQQKTWAEHNFAEPARRAFNRIGVEVEVDLYQDSLTGRIKGYLKKEPIALIYVAGRSWLERVKIAPLSIRHWFIRRLLCRPWSYPLAGNSSGLNS